MPEIPPIVTVLCIRQGDPQDPANVPSIGTAPHLYQLPNADFDATITTLRGAGFVVVERISDVVRTP